MHIIKTLIWQIVNLSINKEGLNRMTIKIPIKIIGIIINIIIAMFTIINVLTIFYNLIFKILIFIRLKFDNNNK